MAVAGERERLPLFVRVPPPLTFAAAFALGLVLQRVAPLPLPQGPWLDAMHAAGAVVANAGLLLALVCLGMFVHRRTTILPARTATAIVDRGPYRFSRNPMYLSLILAYAGLAGMLGSPWSLLFLPLPVATLQRVTIPHEEARLAMALGDDYARYRARVRRWI
ncbi:MAG TPA: isoprenylcysteine carboxylmethyltransferase family protein [Luteimonas sp.]|nr:isoprenylcysteine carboxylmethyltransferase family protein [Luteimonas sp.]